MNPIDSIVTQNIGFLQLAFGAVLITAAIFSSRLIKLDLEKDFLIASLRTTIQLLVVGFILRWILGSDSLVVNLSSLFVMSVAAGQAVTSRLKNKTFKLFVTAQAAIVIGVWPLGLISIGILFQPSTFAKAAFFVPFMGVLLGNALSAISLTFLGLQRVQIENMLEIETFMALGASPAEACRRLYRDLLRNSLTPILNGMTIVGIVSLPGVMAGQVLGGVDPLVAAQTQILLMFVVLITSLTGALAALAIFHLYFMPAWLRRRNSRWSFQTHEPNRLAVSGPSGAGKSRLLKSMAGLDAEAIRQNLFFKSGMAPDENSFQRMIYVHQKPFFVPGTVEQNLKWPFQFSANAHQTYDSESAIRYIELLGLNSKVLQQSVSNLSGGEAQLINLTRSLLLKPEIFYLDEPTASLDSLRTASVENLLNNWLAENSSRRLVLITHSSDQIKRFCTQTLYLDEGKLKYE